MTFQKSLIDKYDSVLRQFNMPNYKLLYPPLSEIEIINILNKLKITETGFLDLYSWKNGFDIDNDVHIRCQINLCGAFQALESVFETWKVSVEDSIWNESFIPILTEGDGEYILFNNEPGNNNGKFYFYSASLLFIEPISYYDSITTLFETEIEAYQSGAIQYDPNDNWLNIDLKKYKAIGAKHNPGSNYWTFKR